VVKSVCYSSSHQSPVANRQSLFTIRYSPLAIRRRFGSPGASPSQFLSLPSRVPSPSSRSKSALMFPCHQLRTEVCFGCKRAGVQRYESAIRQAILHATGFSQWLVTGFNERRIHSAIILDGASLDAPKIFWQCGSTALQKNCSPLATRRSLRLQSRQNFLCIHRLFNLFIAHNFPIAEANDALAVP
jgi:hypothetical protein